MGATVPWPAIRHAYETTPISFRRLAAEYGIRSNNTIRRRIKREGWQRDGRALMASLTPPSTSASPQPPPLAARGPAPRFPWHTIREAYETEPVSLRTLAARFGVSRTRIRTRRDREGWVAAPRVVAVRALRWLGRPALIAAAEAHPPSFVPGVHASGVGQCDGLLRVSGTSGPAMAPETASLSSAVRRDAASVEDGTPPDGLPANEPDARAEQAGATLSQLKKGGVIRETGLLLLRLVRAVLVGPDEARAYACQQLNDSGMSIVSALRCAMRLIASGANIERQAVGLAWGMTPERRAAARSWGAAMRAFDDALPDINEFLPDLEA
jgi:hypothetical protein